VIRIYRTKENRYWMANDENNVLKHIGVCDIDESFMMLLVSSLDGKFIIVDITPDAFKKLMIEEGYYQE